MNAPAIVRPAVSHPRFRFGLVLSTGLALALCGCVQMVPIKNRRVTPMNAYNVPTKTGANGVQTIHSTFALRGHTRTFSYDLLAWKFAGLPYIKSADGIWILLDTGLAESAYVTLDIVSRKGWPAHLGKPVNFSYTPRLELDGIAAVDFLAVINESQYQVRLLGLPVFRASGIVMGDPFLALASYLAFDTSRRKVTIGCEPFVPAAPRVWASYPFDTNGESPPPRLGGRWPPAVVPWIHLPVAGHMIHLVPDSGGGRRLILDAQQWAEIAPALHVRSHRVARYPTWGGFQTVDCYQVADLPFGPIHRRNEVVWVRRGQLRETAPVIGLGAFRAETVVWDFVKNRFWIGL